MRIGVVIDGVPAGWQIRCADALASVEGVQVAPWIPVSANTTSGSSGPRSDDGLDIVLDLTSGGYPGTLAGSPEVWQFRYGLGEDPDATRAVLVDSIRGPGRSRVALVTLPSGRVLRQGWLSWTRGEELERIRNDTADWPALIALDLMTSSTSEGVRAPAEGPPATGDPGMTAPRRRPAAAPPRALLRLAAAGQRVVRAPSVLVRQDDWNVGFIDEPIAQVVAEPGAVARARWLPRRPGHFVADPFGIERDGSLHLFLEDYDQSLGRGSIGHVEVSPNGEISTVEPVLVPDVHASYPYVLEHDGRVLMIPETSAAGELRLYEAKEFPRTWVQVGALLPGVPAVDATVFPYDGRWWLFATRADRGANNNLYVWHAAAPYGPWTSHDRNPVKTDARSARPAGTPFVVDGRLFRPAQDSLLAYGRRVVVNEVLVLTPERFSERPARYVEPPPGSRLADGLHTLSAAGRRTLIDGNQRHLVPTAVRRQLLGRLSLSRP